MNDYDNKADRAKESVKFSIKIMLMVGEESDKICVEFSQKQGDHTQFLKAFKLIRDGVIDL